MKRKQAELNAAVSSECFRLLRLTQEVQSDAKVLKAVVDEVDVLRLYRVLGMTVSNEDDQVAKYNFEFGQFQPSDYDADFSRFVRDKLKATNEDDEHQLQVACLFGKQLDVKEELVRMGYWRKCEEGLFFHNQGVFFIIGEGSPTQLVVFAWLDASLFEPEVIRSTQRMYSDSSPR
ncbi:hypothetical protein P3T76_009635 [Phytophthora citrophthora]|uniref:Uncharacterized protein n=1 Tax=Phytophthora citrophthora TaxID=4793 RepID=A0AAD9LIG3_9STRA|nr:hypothetical protein P3T76_009635 [Phytophthora citrophthora]